MNISRLASMCLALGLCSLGAFQAKADFYVVVGDGTEYVFSPGDTAVEIPIYGYNTATITPITFTAFDLAFDVSSVADGYNGAGIPGNYFTNFGGIPVAGTVYVDDAPDPVGAPGHDVIYSATIGSGLLLPPAGTLATAVKLGTFTFDISGATPSGIYGFKFVPNATYDGSTLVNSASTNPVFQVVSGETYRNQFRVIPEPSSFALLALGTLGVCSRRRRLSSV
ncbi:MAG: PEP-CTERM sorting domain-containing protein [Pirellulaceae bacterium]|nr:PEP-CTERM sorting domain-containing protein [Pirellulaceae bacterium]